MINLKKLVKMARKWQKVAAMRRKRIALPKAYEVSDAHLCSPSAVPDKGHFVVYISDERRFVIPLVYLNKEIIRELLSMSEEFGIQSAGTIRLPCDSVFFEYVISCIKSGVHEELERALIMCIASSNCSSSSDFHHEQTNEQLLLCAC